MIITETTPEYEIEQQYTWVRDVAQSTCPTCGEPTGFCYLQCPNSPEYYSPEREREDALFEDSLPHSTWFSEAVRQYDRIYGEGAYCS